MTKYRIAYIDESDSDIRRFQRFSYNFFEVVPFIPKESIEETCNVMTSLKVMLMLLYLILSFLNNFQMFIMMEQI